MQLSVYDFIKKHATLYFFRETHKLIHNKSAKWHCGHHTPIKKTSKP